MKLTQEVVKALCDAAQEEWDKAGLRTRKRAVRFRWRGKEYVSTLTNFRLLVHTAAGEPVCCRWH